MKLVKLMNIGEFARELERFPTYIVNETEYYNGVMVYCFMQNLHNGGETRYKGLYIFTSLR